VALFKLYYFYSEEEQVDHLTRAKVVEAKRLTAEERSCAFKARIATLAHLLCLKRVYKKVCLKEYRLIEQGLYKLEADKRSST